MGIRVAGKFRLELDRFARQIESEFKATSQAISVQANKDIQDNLFMSVYGTTPGNFYKRTGDLKSLSHTNAVLMNAGSVYRIRLKSDLDYASDIEYGSGDLELNPTSLLEISEAGKGEDIYFGRTGRNYTLPGPFIMPATVKARINLEDAFVKIIKNRWR